MKDIKGDLRTLVLCSFIAGILLITLIFHKRLPGFVDPYPFWTLMVVELIYVGIIIGQFIRIFKQLKKFEAFDKIMQDFKN